jgi:hypothetical protein
MTVCEVCGNDYDKAFQVVGGGETRTFDIFESARSRRWPRLHSLRLPCDRASRLTARSTAAPTVPPRPASKASPTAPERDRRLRP